MSLTLQTGKQSFQHTAGGNLTIPDKILWSNWRDIKIAYFDLETTSFQPAPQQEGQSFQEWLDIHHNNRIVEFGCQIRQGSEVIDTFYQLINPTVPISDEVSAIHGITNEMVAGMPTFDQCADAIAAFMSKADVVCAYNGLSFDKPFIELEMSRAIGQPIVLNKFLIDPYILFVEVNKKRGFKGGNKLFKAASHYGCGQVSQIAYGEANAHRTEPDINMCADLLIKMGERDLAFTLDELIENQELWHQSQLTYREQLNKRPKRYRPGEKF